MTIAIINEFPILRNALKFFITDNFGDVKVIESRSIVDFHEAYPNHKPDVIIIALSQNKAYGNLHIINMVKKWYDPRTAIIYDEKVDLAMIPKYLRAGAQGYISKHSGLDEFKNCIQQVLRGKRYVDMEILLNDRLYHEGKMYPKSIGCLTARQYEIALYISEGKSTTWIAQKLERSASTISTVKMNIFKRLAVDNAISLRELMLSDRAN